MPESKETKESEKLRKSRESVRNRLDTFAKYIDKIAIPGSSDNLPVTELSVRLDRAETIIEEFEVVQGKIDALVDDVSVEIKYREDFENVYFSTIAKAKELLQPKPIISSNENANQSSVSDRNSSFNSGIKLPTLHLRQFSGNYSTWLDYHDCFDTIIVKNNDISDIQKFHYLKSSLSGTAEKIINSIKVSAANFTVAWKLLCDRYSNEPLLIHNHIKSIFNLKVVNRDSSKCLQHLIDGLTSNLRSLESLGEPVSTWDSIIIFIILEKLDPETVKDWDKESRGNAPTSVKPTLDDLLKFLQHRADTLEKFEARSIKGGSSSKDHSHSSSHRSKTHTSQSFINNGAFSDLCPHCNGPHKMSTCTSFQNLDVHARMREVKRVRACFNCLFIGHQNTSCKYGKCKKCGKKHHTLLHVNAENSNSPNDTQSVSSDNQTPQTLSFHAVQNSFALLSTVTVQIADRSGVKHNFRALLDSGSQSHFVTYSLVSKLGLSKEPADISVVGVTQISSRIKHKTHDNSTITTQRDTTQINDSEYTIHATTEISNAHEVKFH
ncbi:uncharacterized protein LOC126886285 [Diabrotica virgifera virgifera]|uniref:Peptidase aspartic putative domain-containing protein n=1 Tax=Diabrotica virgifera virgifera TaxID=50390 RepID=A0ABM5KG31_DIAVI|nr:uncharacterized protein LOC126886285 [Diabrotica virgifera virgifera]